MQVYAVLYFVAVRQPTIAQYPSGFIDWCWVYCKNAPMKQPWRMLVNKSHEPPCNVLTVKQKTKTPCAHFIIYDVVAPHGPSHHSNSSHSTFLSALVFSSAVVPCEFVHDQLVMMTRSRVCLFSSALSINHGSREWFNWSLIHVSSRADW